MINTKFSEHFVRFVIRGEEVDFDAFRTKEELDRYLEEVKRFNEASDEEVDEIARSYITKK